MGWPYCAAGLGNVDQKVNALETMAISKKQGLSAEEVTRRCHEDPKIRGPHRRDVVVNVKELKKRALTLTSLLKLPNNGELGLNFLASTDGISKNQADRKVR